MSSKVPEDMKRAWKLLSEWISTYTDNLQEYFTQVSHWYLSTILANSAETLLTVGFTSEAICRLHEFKHGKHLHVSKFWMYRAWMWSMVSVRRVVIDLGIPKIKTKPGIRSSANSEHGVIMQNKSF